MKICHLTSVHPRFDTRIFIKECSSLAQAGYQVSLVVADGQGNSAKNGVQIYDVGAPRGRLERMVQTTRRVFAKAIALNADVYHIHDPELLVWVQLLRARKSSVIYDMHENVPKSILTKPWVKPFIRPLLASFYKIIERVLLHKIPIIFAENSYQKDYKWAQTYTTVLNMPLATELLSFKQKKYQYHTVGYMGGVTPLRGTDTTLRALHVLKKRNKRVEWECVGPGSEEHLADLKTLAHSLELEDIRFRGYMRPNEGWKIMARCDVGLALLQKVPNYVESYPTKMFEYMALGIPVIASNFELYRQVVEGNGCGLCVDPEKPIEIADAIEWLLDNPKKAHELGQNGYRAVQEKYNWLIEEQKLMLLYKNLC